MEMEPTFIARSMNVDLQLTAEMEPEDKKVEENFISEYSDENEDPDENMIIIN